MLLRLLSAAIIRTLLFAVFVAASACALPKEAQAGFAATPVIQANLDPSAFAAWSDGRESSAGLPSDGPSAAVFTDKSAPSRVIFGDSSEPGTRYLRIGFKSPVAVGSVLVCGGGVLSVLKSSAAYPGRLDDDSDWIPAERLDGSSVDDAEVGQDDYAIWELPSGTATRALRFTHIARRTDRSYAGVLEGAFVSAERTVNLAPFGTAIAGSSSYDAAKINDGSLDGWWQAWDNGAQGASAVISLQHPEWILLTWPHEVTLGGLCALWAGFDAATVQAYAGRVNADVRAAPESSWRTVGSYTNLRNQFGRALGPNWMPFSAPVTTRAIRLLITQPTSQTDGNLSGKSIGGKRVWLGELMALSMLDGSSPADAIPAQPKSAEVHAPIPIRFTLQKASYVTLVIDDFTGHRVRNLVSETLFPSGDNVVWWDGLDDLGRGVDDAKHAVYRVPGKLVAAGDYRVRGLYRQQIDLRYQFSVYNNAHPAWTTSNPSSMWLANHTPPSSIAYVPAGVAPNRDGTNAPSPAQMLIGSYITEGGSGLAWVDLHGNKIYGLGWVGGLWTGAQYIARDDGPKALPGVYAYTASPWKGGSKYGQQAELRVQELINRAAPNAPKSNDEAPDVISPHFPLPDSDSAVVGGLAAYNGIVATSLPVMNQVVFMNAGSHKLIGKVSIPDPHGLAFDVKGRLLVLSGKRLLRYALAMPRFAGDIDLSAPVVLVAEGLEDPQNLTLDSQGDIYVSDWGGSQQVKVFTPDGKFLRAIGKAGSPGAGPYDPTQMRQPEGIAIDGNDRLWVAEDTFQPKRVSVWNLDGSFIQAFYGPPKYGGGGELDPTDKSLFYYDGMAFKIDWATGKNWPVDVLWMADGDHPGGNLGFRAGFPETPIYARGNKYFSDSFSSWPTRGTEIAYLWKMEKGAAKLVAAAGIANFWDALNTPAFQSALPAGVDLTKKDGPSQVFFIWTDLNGNGLPDPGEVQFAKATVGSTFGNTIFNRDLSFTVARFNGDTLLFKPVGVTEGVAPKYDITKGKVLATDVQRPGDDSGDQAMLADNGWSILSDIPKPFSPLSVAGVHDGVTMWTYPSLWPGLASSHNAAMPDRSGELVGTTRLIGYPISAPDNAVGDLWAINGNMGNIYVFTTDGLMVATLFHDSRGVSWSMPSEKRDMPVGDVSLGQEDFFPEWTQLADGAVYLQANNSLMIRLDGLDTIHRMPDAALKVTPDVLHEAHDYFVDQEAAREDASGPDQDILTIARVATPPSLNNGLADWANADWATIENRVEQIGSWGHEAQHIQAALAVSGDRLYAAYKTGDPKLLVNSGQLPTHLFKTGGALDLMLGAVPGGERLLVAQVKGKTIAEYYRVKSPGLGAPPVSFSSPVQTVTIDEVRDVTDQVTLDEDKSGDYEISVPLVLLHLSSGAVANIAGDVGVLRGDGFETLQRVYWHNKATGLDADVPGEAELTPKLWGELRFGGP